MNGMDIDGTTMARAYATATRQLCDAKVELLAARRALVAIALCADPERGREIAEVLVINMPVADVASLLPTEMTGRLERLEA